VLVMETAELEGEHEQGRAVVVGAVRVPRGASVGEARQQEEEGTFWAAEATWGEKGRAWERC
jgi:hypothetical protein